MIRNARADFDPVSLVEQGYSRHGSATQWGQSMIAQVTELFDPDRLGAFGWVLDAVQGRSGHFGVQGSGEAFDSADVEEWHGQVLSWFPPGKQAAMFAPLGVPGVYSLADITHASPIFSEADLRDYLRHAASLTPGATKLADSVAVSLPLGCRTMLFITSRVREVSIDSRERALWRMICAHLSAGLRLCDRAADPEAADVDCILHPDGRSAHAKGLALSRRAQQSLSLSVKRVESVRTRAGRADPERALETWRALFHRCWSLVEHEESDGRRLILARRNEPIMPPETGPSRALPRRQRQVLYCVGAGLSNKETAYLLGVGGAAVATHLRRGLSRLGVRSRREWVSLCGHAEGQAVVASSQPGDALAEPASADTLPARSQLSDAESEVAMLITKGLSSAEVARTRGTSVNTVSNQLRSVYSKLGVSDRHELTQRMAREGLAP